MNTRAKIRVAPVGLLLVASIVTGTVCLGVPPRPEPRQPPPPPVVDTRPRYEQPKSPVIQQALERCFVDMFQARQDLRALQAQGKVERRRTVQGLWTALITTTNEFYDVAFRSETGPIQEFQKRVYADDQYQRELREFGYHLRFDGDGRIQAYERRSASEGLTFYQNRGLERFWANIADQRSVEASWDVDGKLLSETVSTRLPRDEKGLPELEKALRYGDDAKKWEAVHAMVEIGPASIPCALNVLQDGDPPSRERAAFLFGFIHENAAAFVPTLARRLREDDSPAVRKMIALSLGGVGSSAEAAIPALQEAVASDVPEVARPAKFSLERIQKSLAR